MPDFYPQLCKPHQKLLSFLSKFSASPSQYLLIILLLKCAIGMVLILITDMFIVDIPYETLQFDFQSIDTEALKADLFGYCLFAPLLENSLVFVFCWLLNKRALNDFLVCVLCAALAAILHYEKSGLMNGIYTLFSFYFYSISYFLIPNKKKAFLICFILHAINNAVPVGLGQVMDI